MTNNQFGRRKNAKQLRDDQAEYAYLREHPNQLNNGDESRYTNFSGDLYFIGNFTKGFEHDPGSGELTPDGINSYLEMLRALNSGLPADFEAISMTFSPPERKLVDPQAGLAFDLEGPDAQSVTVPPAPALESAQLSGELAEMYWMMICRDFPFQDIQSVGPAEVADALDPTIDGSLNWAGFTDLRPHLAVDPTTNQVTGQTIFRGTAPGCLVGPYISQFLLIGNEYPDPSQYAGGPLFPPDQGYIRYGTQVIDQRQASVQPNINFVGEWNEYIQVQNGYDPYAAGIMNQLMPPPRFITTPRDLANYVHYDALYQAYLNACIILLSMSARLDRGNPYLASMNQDGFGTFGGPHILSLVTEVATRALKAVWYQKWFVHRRLRPEAAGGVMEGIHRGFVLPLNQEIQTAFAAAGPFENYVMNSNNMSIPPGVNSYLLNQVFPEGSPMHPSYGAGHATVAGACVTILKAFFDESMPFNTLFEPDPSGMNLMPVGGVTSTVGYELNKLAYNIAYGRAMAGVHYRSDNDVSLKLGEELAIQILQEQKPTYNENGFFTLTKFDGTMIKI